MADESNKPKDPAEGAGTKAHKPTKAELAKLPGGEDFDVDNASPEDFEKHAEILRRRQLVGGLVPQAASAAVAAPVDPATAVAPGPNPGDIRAVNKAGEERYFSPETWALMGENTFGWKEAVAKPKDI